MNDNVEVSYFHGRSLADREREAVIDQVVEIVAGRDVRSVYRWANGMVMVFGDDGEQIPELQGEATLNRLAAIRDRSRLDTDWFWLRRERAVAMAPGAIPHRYEGELMTHLVVMEATVANRKIWAWCTVTTGPGFDAVAYTMADGVTPVDLEGVDVPLLDRHLFTVLVDVGEKP